MKEGRTKQPIHVYTGVCTYAYKRKKDYWSSEYDEDDKPAVE